MWVSTRERLPSIADGIEDSGGDVVVLVMMKYAHGNYPELKPISLISKDTFNVAKYYPYWMPIHEVKHD